MAVTFQNSARYVSATGQTSYSPTHNLSLGSGNGRLVIVSVNWEDDGTDSVSTITLGGNSPDGSQTAIAGTGFSAFAGLYWWYDSNLPASSGNTTIAVTATGTVNREIMVHVMEFTGVDQVSTVNTGTDTTTTAGDVSTSVTVDADDSLGAGTFTAGNTTFGTPTNLTQAQAGAATSSAGGIGYNINVDGSSITLGWTSMSTRGAFVGAVFQESSSSSSSSTSSSSSSSSTSSSSSSTSSSSSSSSQSCVLQQDLWQIIDSTVSSDLVNLYIAWRECTTKIESFITSGSSSRDILLEWDDGDTNTGSVVMSASDQFDVGCCLFLNLSGGVPIPDFFYQIQYFDAGASLEIRLLEDGGRRLTEGDVGTVNRIID